MPVVIVGVGPAPTDDWPLLLGIAVSLVAEPALPSLPLVFPAVFPAEVLCPACPVVGWLLLGLPAVGFVEAWPEFGCPVVV